MKNKYAQFRIPYLIEPVQSHCVLMKNKNYRKTLTPSRLAKINTDMDQMRSVITEALIHGNRLHPLFFPTGCYILYQRASVPVEWDDFDSPQVQPERLGRVKGHTETKVIVQLEADEFAIEVEPADLKIAFLRK